MVTISTHTAGSFAARIAGAGPVVGMSEAANVVADLREQVEQARGVVTELTGLEVPDVEVRILSRAAWAKAVVVSLEAAFPESWISRDVRAHAGFVSSSAYGVAVGAVARRALGQYVPEGFSGREGQLYLVAPNILEFRKDFGLDQRDLAMWMCVHELTHAAQFAAAPWLSDVIISHTRALMEAGDGADISFDEGAGAEVNAVMSLLEGHADYVMNDVPVAFIPGKQRLIESMTKRRSSSNVLAKFFQQSIGLDKKMEQYGAGRAFVEAVVSEVGYEGLNAVWDNPLNLPSADEISHPLSWIHRMQ
ncbi:zinc-dependent metalloprotease [Arcanobacterium haemolyticum]|nr:zinc-dependent metalloprotease [Arcanobacterium haemolyticum]